MRNTLTSHTLLPSHKFDYFSLRNYSCWQRTLPLQMVAIRITSRGNVSFSYTTTHTQVHFSIWQRRMLSNWHITWCYLRWEERRVFVREFHFCIGYLLQRDPTAKQRATEQNEREMREIQRKWNKKMQETKKSMTRSRRRWQGLRWWGVARWGEAHRLPLHLAKIHPWLKETLCTLRRWQFFTTFVRIPHSRLESCSLSRVRVSWFSLTFYTDAVLQACVKHSHAPNSCPPLLPAQMRIN